jgi:hypothetical protein
VYFDARTLVLHRVESDQLKTRNEERSAELNDKAEGVRIARENAEQLRKKKAVLEKKVRDVDIVLPL